MTSFSWFEALVLPRWGAAALLAGACAVAAAPLPTQPVPVIEVGMHTADITAIAADRSDRWAVTVSLDKTARVWDIASGTPLAVLRPPQGAANEGKLYAVAMSGDGSTVALGGWTSGEASNSFELYLFNRASGALARRITGLPSVVNDLAYAPDNRLLAACTGPGGGVHVFDSASGRELSRDAEYAQGARHLHFSADGRRLVSVGMDGLLRLYAVDGGRLQRLASVPLAGGRQPASPRFSPDGRFIAVGFADSAVVQVLDANNLAEVARPVSDPRIMNVALAWSADGAFLYGAGIGPIGILNVVRSWSTTNPGRFGDSQPVASSTVTALVPLRDGRMLFSSVQPAWGLLQANGQVQRYYPLGADFRIQNNEFRTSADGRRVRFSHLMGSFPPQVFDLAAGGLVADDPRLRPARSAVPGLVVENTIGRRDPTLNGQPLRLQAMEVARSVDIVPAGDRFVLGTDWGLLLFDSQGRPLWRQDVSSVAWAVAVTGDGRHVVAGHSDGTIRWRRVEDGREVLALFVHADRQRWVSWTPEGFFDASPGGGTGALAGGEQLIGYHLNRGRDQAGEFVSARQLRERFMQPGLVARVLEPGGAALLAAAITRLGDARQLLAGETSLPPEVQLVSQPSSQSASGEVVVTVKLKDRGGGVGGLTFFLDGKPMEGRQAGVIGDGTVSRSFVLPPGKRRIEVAGASRSGVEGQRVAMEVNVSGAAAPTALHILAVGIEKYRDRRLELRNSANDATQIAAEFAARAKPLFKRGVFTRVLTDEQAALGSIQAAFDDIKKQIQSDDTLLIFLAGHGETAPTGGYTFLPWDFSRGTPGAGEGLNEARLQAMLNGSPSKTLLLLDTCEAGGAQDLVSGAYKRLNGLTHHVLIGASRKGEMAREGYGGHGVFTAAVLETLRRRPESADDKVMTVLDLRAQVGKSVERISSSMPGYLQKVSGFIGSAEFPLVSR